MASFLQLSRPDFHPSRTGRVLLLGKRLNKRKTQVHTCSWHRNPPFNPHSYMWSAGSVSIMAKVDQLPQRQSHPRQPGKSETRTNWDERNVVGLVTEHTEANSRESLHLIPMNQMVPK